MMAARWTLLLPLLWGLLHPAVSPIVKARTTPAPAVVRAVLFYSPTCGHCHYVIEEVLPPLMRTYGDRLQIIGVDVSTAEGFHLFEAAWSYYDVKGTGVPFLAIGDQYLVGSMDIPQKFPGLIESYLVQGGLDWPAIPGLAEVVQAAQPQPTATPLPTVAATAPLLLPVEPSVPATASEADQPAAPVLTDTPAPLQPSRTPVLSATRPLAFATPQVVSEVSQLNQPPAGLSEKFLRDPLGNGLAVLVLVGMVVSLGAGVRGFRQHIAAATAGSRRPAIPVLCVIGMGVAGYLAYVEMTQSLAVCGPVGDCNTVQQSEYARLFGILPIGVLGILGYLGILAAWLVTRYDPERLSSLAAQVMVGMTLFGVLFSIYLTVLEPFVIGATCAWCVTSAVIMTALLWLCLTPAKVAM